LAKQRFEQGKGKPLFGKEKTFWKWVRKFPMASQKGGGKKIYQGGGKRFDVFRFRIILLMGKKRFYIISSRRPKEKMRKKSPC